MKYEAVSVFPFRGAWRADFRRVAEDGSRSRERVRRTFRAEGVEDARAEATRIAREMSLSGATVAEALGSFLERSAGAVGAETLRCYAVAGRRATAHLGGGMPVDAISDSKAAAYVGERLAAGASPNSVRHEVSVLRMAFEEAVAAGAMDANPFFGVRVRGKKLNPPMGEDGIEACRALLGSVAGGVGLIAWLAYDCELRASGLALLERDAVSEDGGSIAVGSGSRARTCELSEKTRILLRGSAQGPYIFGGNSPVHPETLSHRFGRFASAFDLRVGLSDLSKCRRWGLCM